MLGLWVLFLLILLMGLSANMYIYKMGKDSKSILKDNYISIKYAKEMLQQLDQMSNAEKAQQAASVFEKTLKQEESNITEPGEKETVALLRTDFERYRQNPASPQLVNAIRAKIYKITEVNMNALERRNLAVQNNVERAVVYVSLLLAVCILTSFSIIFNIPENMK